jgi:hypothetical protein
MDHALRPAEIGAGCGAESHGLADGFSVLFNCSAIALLVSTGCVAGLETEAAGEGIEENVGALEVVADNQRRGDDEDKALGNPEDDEDFEEETAH